MNLRRSLPVAHAATLLWCHFHSESDRIKLKSLNYNLVSKLDLKSPWVKVAIMLYGYGITLQKEATKDGSQPSAKDDAFNDDVPDSYSKCLSSTSLSELEKEVQLLRFFQSELQTFLQYYRYPDVSAAGCHKEAATLVVKKARGTFLAKAGKEFVEPFCRCARLSKKGKQVDLNS